MSDTVQKSKEDILAERKAKKKNKAAAKVKSKSKNESDLKKEETKSADEPQRIGNEAVVTADAASTGDSIKVHGEESVKSLISNTEIKTSININNEDKPSNLVTENELSDKMQSLNMGSGEKSKAQLRAERRMKQEAQRAKKLEKATAVVSSPAVTATVSNSVQSDTKVSKPTALKTTVAIAASATVATKTTHKVRLFAHLYVDNKLKLVPPDLHPDIIRLGSQYSSRIIIGSNVRCLALLNTFKKVINDFETPENQEFSRGLEAVITKSMTYLNSCRPIAVSMMNATKNLKFRINNIKGSESESKVILSDWIDTYIKEQLEKAAEAICLSVYEKISSGDVILTYGFSSLIQRILISAHKKKMKFRVIVVDGRPRLEGKEMLRRLVTAGIHCTYVFFNGLSFIMPEVTKILLGAHALLSNGYVMSRAGSSQVALLAKVYNVPVLVCCETHKFSERVQTDSFVYNELGDPDELSSNKGCFSKKLKKWKSIPYLTSLNLTYDVTPPDLVSAVVTEVAVLPCTSVPVILRLHF